MSKEFVIIAPHADDELIGCYTLFHYGLVVGVYYLTDMGNPALGEDFGIFQKQCAFDDLPRIVLEPISYGAVKLDNPGIYLVPDNSDHHPLHRMLSNIAKYWVARRIGYYTIDMVSGFTRELPPDLQDAKRRCLGQYYPEKSDLWESDHRYFLFEGLVYDLLTAATKG